MRTPCPPFRSLGDGSFDSPCPGDQPRLFSRWPAGAISVSFTGDPEAARGIRDLSLGRETAPGHRYRRGAAAGAQTKEALWSFCIDHRMALGIWGFHSARRRCPEPGKSLSLLWAMVFLAVDPRGPRSPLPEKTRAAGRRSRHPVWESECRGREGPVEVDGIGDRGSGPCQRGRNFPCTELVT